MCTWEAGLSLCYSRPPCITSFRVERPSCRVSSQTHLVTQCPNLWKSCDAKAFYSRVPTVVKSQHPPDLKGMKLGYDFLVHIPCKFIYLFFLSDFVLLTVTNGTSHSPTALNGAPSPPNGFSNGPSSSSSSSLANQQLPPACGARQLSKLKRFLTTLQQFGNDISPEIGERVRTLVLGLVVSKRK